VVTDTLLGVFFLNGPSRLVFQKSKFLLDQGKTCNIIPH
jgi:hypothetical protein